MSNQRKKQQSFSLIERKKHFHDRNSNKRPNSNQLRRQLTDESPNKQRTPPNSVAASLSPHSSSFLTRDTNPIRITSNASNTIRMSSSATSKQLDSVTLLLKQTIAPTQLLQVMTKELFIYLFIYFS